VETDDAPVDPESSAADVPDWDRDPTFAELRPDFDALELAMAEVRDEANDEPMPEPEPARQSRSGNTDKAQPDEIPEITLDQAIQTGIQDNLIDEPGEISPTTEHPPEKSAADTAVPDIRMPPRQSRKADAELEKIAAELAKAKTLEDVDDRMAETLFGEEISLVAAQVLANPPPSDPANDDGPPVATGTPATAQTARETESTAAPHLELELETPPDGGSGLSPSASQRLKTVRALNADRQPQPGAAKPTRSADAPSAAVRTPPEPIEDQINTSMTQTLKALNVRPPVATPSHAEDDDEQERKKGGFFGRFRR